MNQRILTMTTIGAVVATLALAGCDKRAQTDARDGSGSTVASAEQRARDMGNDARSSLDKAKDATENAAAKMGEKVDDAVITTAVKTELAKDPDLSALRINVDTANGRVALKGKAPSNEAREHATTLAQNVKGVVSVDNQLAVEPGKM
ncbi:MAG TPA: BON domain-containing protein [Burkholderiaceae bacterium]|nr:BON domain-containing protein [Burkholderiaceae bacterium]